MENEKKVYKTPEVTKVEFDASDRITASSCPPIPNPFGGSYPLYEFEP